MLSAGEVAARTRLNVVTVRRALKAGRLKGTKPHGVAHWRISEAALEEWLAPKPREPEVGVGRRMSRRNNEFLRAIEGGN